MKTAKRFLLLTLAVVFAVSAFGCKFSFSTAKIEDAIMTETVDQDGVPGEEVVSFPADASILYTSAKLVNAPDHTQVRIVWSYVTEGEMIDEVELDSGTISSRYIYSFVEANDLIPAGDYKVEYFIGDREEPDATVKFVILPVETKQAEETPVAPAVVETQGAYLEEVSMTTDVSADGYPVDSVDTLAPTGTWYVSAVLRNATEDTIIHYVWYDTQGNIIDEYDFDPQGGTDIYIFGNLVLNTVASAGQYLVEIYIDGAAEPAAAVRFNVTAASADVAKPEGYTLYTQPQGWYSIYYPSDWLMLEDPEGLDAIFYPSEYEITGQDDINVVYTLALPGSASGTSIGDLIDGWIADTEADNLENYVFLDRGTETINGSDMAYCEYSWARDGYDLYSIDFLFVRGNDVFIITFTGTHDNVDELFDYVREMVLSFQIL